jgi:hypothetical protein
MAKKYLSRQDAYNTYLLKIIDSKNYADARKVVVCAENNLILTLDDLSKLQAMAAFKHEQKMKKYVN